MIGTATLLIGALLAWLRGWYPFSYEIMLTTVVLGVAYTIFSEVKCRGLEQLVL